MLSHHSGARSLTDGEPTEKPARPGAFQISEQVARTGRRKLYAAEPDFLMRTCWLCKKQVSVVRNNEESAC